MATVPAVTILSHADRQRLAYDLLQQFNVKGLKEYSSYSARNASLIKRASKLISDNPNAATSFLKTIGRNVSYDVSTKQKRIQQKQAKDILLAVKPKKPEIQGPQEPRKLYVVKRFKKKGISYKTCTSLFKPFTTDQSLDSDFLQDYLDAIDTKKDYIKFPEYLIDIIFQNEASGFERMYSKVQGITEDYPVDSGILKAQFTGSGTSDIGSGPRRTKQELEIFELIKYIRLTFRTVPNAP